MAAETRNTKTDRCLTAEITSIFRTHPGARKIKQNQRTFGISKSNHRHQIPNIRSRLPRLSDVLITADETEQQSKYDTSSRWVTASAFLTRNEQIMALSTKREIYGLRYSEA